MKAKTIISILFFTLVTLCINAQDAPWLRILPISGNDSMFMFINPGNPNTEAEIVGDSIAYAYLSQISPLYAGGAERRYLEFLQAYEGAKRADRYREQLLPRNQGYPSLVDVSSLKFNQVYALDSLERGYESSIRIGSDTTMNCEIYLNNTGNPLLVIEGDTTNTRYPVTFRVNDFEVQIGSQNRRFPIVDSIVRLRKVSTREDQRKSVILYRKEMLDGRNFTLRWKIK